MDYEGLKKILTGTKKFHTADGDIWHFNDTTITINHTPITHYLLYLERDTGALVIMSTQPLEVAEDYLVTVEGEEGHYTLILTPRVSKQKVIRLEQSP
ncbi:MAG: hypothetical protein V4557_18175 [Bacteroidota bacterium]